MTAEAEDILEQAPVGMLRLDAGGRIARLNPAAAQCLGRDDPAACLGLALRDLLPETLPDLPRDGTVALVAGPEGGTLLCLRAAALSGDGGRVVALLPWCPGGGPGAFAMPGEALMLIAPDPEAATDLAAARILAANDAAGAWLDDRPAALPGQRLEDASRALTDPRAWERARAGFAAGTPVTTLCTQATGQDGTAGFLLSEWSLWPLCRPDGAPGLWVDRRRAVTHQGHDPATMTGRDELINDALAASQVGIWHWDLRDNHVTWSKRLLSELGYDLAEINDPDAFMARLFHPEDRPLLRRSIDDAVLGDGHFEYIARLRHRDGGMRSILVRGQVICDEAGTPIRLVGTESDVSEEVLLRDRLLRAEQIARIGNWAYTPERTSMYWSPEIFRIHGLEPGPAAPDFDTALGYIHPDDRDGLREAIRQSFTGQWGPSGRVHVSRARIIGADGVTRHAEISTVINLDLHGRPISATGTMQDITAKVETEERLVQSQKMEVVGQLAGGIAHDFNNLLAVIMGNLELLEEELSRPGEIGLIQTAIEAARKGAALTRNLLSFARKASLEPRRSDLNALIEGLDPMLERVLPESIALRRRFARDLWVVQADRNSFENALLNLVINARDAMEGAGTLSLETANKLLDAPYIEAGQEDLPPGPYAVVSVSDTGSGMTPEVLAQVFAPFFTTKPPSRGSGLGLSMVQGFMRQSGGSVRLYSEPGVGTTVKLFFPAAMLEDSLLPGHGAPETLPAVPRAGRVLLAEDDPAVTRMLAARLERMGFQVVPAASGDEAARIFAADPGFDLLLTDIVMPGTLQGPGLARHLRVLAPGLKVIFMSGYPNEAMVHGNGLRPEDIRLMKPIGRQELEQALARALPQPENGA